MNHIVKHIIFAICFVCMAGCENKKNNSSIEAAVPSTNQLENLENDSNTEVVSNQNEANQTIIKGRVFDSAYLEGMSVCAVSKDENTCDEKSEVVQTNEVGQFSLPTVNNTQYLLAYSGTEPNQISYRVEYDISYSDEIMISPLTTLKSAKANWDYLDMKATLGIDQDFMLRFDDPFISPEEKNNQVKKINTQLMVLFEALASLSVIEDGNNTIIEVLAETILNNESLFLFTDTQSIQSIFNAINFDGSSQDGVIINLSAVISAFLQKIWIDEDEQYQLVISAIKNKIPEIVNAITTISMEEPVLNEIIFNTLDYIRPLISEADFVYEDTEADFNLTTYLIDHVGTEYFTVDGVNAKTTDIVIYAKLGDKIQFQPVDSSIFVNHPFRISTVKNDTSGSSDIGVELGWDQSSYTLTILESTPKLLYPHCGYHDGMFLSGGVEVVDVFDITNIDVNNDTSALQVKGTISSGPFLGASGYTYDVYLRQPASEPTHEHTFLEYPGLVFYMPEDQGNHGDNQKQVLLQFKPKSHYE